MTVMAALSRPLLEFAVPPQLVRLAVATMSLTSSLVAVCSRVPSCDWLPALSQVTKPRRWLPAAREVSKLQSPWASA
ncbi:hypothetical protein D9M68_649220 [compost metagenome]